MPITLNIRPDVQTVLEHEAALQGRAVEAVATALLKGAAAGRIGCPV